MNFRYIWSDITHEYMDIALIKVNLLKDKFSIDN